MSITVGPDAFALPLLHAAKYPDALVCGVLLGEVNSSNGNIDVKSGLSLFHHWASLTPMLEVALKNAELYAAKKKLKIVGWYQANAGLKDTTLHENVIRVADVIRRNSGQAVVFIVNNEKLGQLNEIKDGSVILPYTYSEGQWKGIKQAFTSYNRVIDFDEHLEDVSKDWLSSNTL
ncbi:hypothetical protein BDB00DRAFT_635234 [Zychaea mexicana]|uniref:uncharacterized protein n=1 Tax=Zychaea mexicana TaxID=64656 RepID=UPI0022FE4062|nr:uncharacterized protein BDB00DRAFT_635234 [Zychaea mexicana]KAI9489142.1 hypothetical protein BDB00DRAFT_635234 [Zychaea mexicana]